MGWADCGKDSKGRNIGYAFSAKCDHPGCKTKIDRGLAYACGGMHGESGNGDCEGYFCGEHLYIIRDPKKELHNSQLCAKCTFNWNSALIEELIQKKKEPPEEIKQFLAYLDEILECPDSSIFGKLYKDEDGRACRDVIANTHSLAAGCKKYILDLIN